MKWALGMDWLMTGLAFSGLMLSGLVLSGSSALGRTSQSLPLESLTEETSFPIDGFLAPQSVLETSLRELSHPRLIYVNVDWLRKKGFKLPPKPDSKFRLRLAKILGLGIAGPSESVLAFGPLSKKGRSFRYGGFGAGENLGDGRATSIGNVQLKGVGKTALAQSKSIDHGNGVMPFVEGPREAIWGGLCAKELPFGGNEIIAIVGRGTRSEHQWIGMQDDVIVAREEALRPGHFMPAENSNATLDLATGRVKASTETLLTRLSKKGTGDGGAIIRTELLNYIDRVATQYGTLYARGIYHGAISPSNHQFQGGTLDYGTMSAVPRYEKIYFLEGVEAFGEFDQTYQHLVESFFKSLRSNAPKEWALAIPPPDVTLTRFTSTLNATLSHELVVRTGVPPEVVEKLDQSLEYANLSESLFTLSNFGTRRQLIRGNVPTKSTRYDLNQILVMLAQAPPQSLSQNRILALLEQNGIPPGDPVLIQFADHYAQYLSRAKHEAAKSGVLSENFHRYVRESATLKNKELPNLYRWNLMEKESELAHDYARDPASLKTQEFIERTIQDSRRYYRARKPYEIVLREETDPWSLTTRQNNI